MVMLVDLNCLEVHKSVSLPSFEKETNIIGLATNKRLSLLQCTKYSYFFH